MSLKQMRQVARLHLAQLRGRYSFFLLPILLIFVSSSISYRQEIQTQLDWDWSDTVFPILVNLLNMGITLSVIMSLVYSLRGKKERLTLADAVMIFDNHIIFKVIWLAIVRLIFLLPWLFLTIMGTMINTVGIPALSEIVIYSQDIWSQLRTWVALALVLVGLGLQLFGIVMFVIKCFAYSQAEYVLLDALSDGSYENASKILSESQDLMRKQKFKFFRLHLSFLGWYLLVLITFGFAILYVLPYYLTARAVFYHELRKRLGKKPSTT